jgi:hypothetical protein
MRIIVAFDFKEEDSVGVEAVIFDLLEELSEKTLVCRTYDPTELDLPETSRMRDLDVPLLLELILSSILNLAGNDSKDFSDNLKDILDLEIFTDRLSETLFSERYGL